MGLGLQLLNNTGPKKFTNVVYFLRVGNGYVLVQMAAALNERWLASMDKLFRQHALSYEELPRSKPPCLALLFEADKGRT